MERARKQDQQIIDLTLSRRERADRRRMMARHYKNLKNVKPAIDTGDRRFHELWQRSKNCSRWTKMNEINQRKIRRANDKLIENLTKIAVKPNHRKKEKASKELAFMNVLSKHGRKLKQRQIQRENEVLYKRLRDGNPTIDRKQWKRDWEKHEERLKHLSKCSHHGLKTRRNRIRSVDTARASASGGKLTSRTPPRPASSRPGFHESSKTRHPLTSRRATPKPPARFASARGKHISAGLSQSAGSAECASMLRRLKKAWDDSGGNLHEAELMRSGEFS
eukprot:CAMPEP_0184490656 /NCGR_PEP_ID=MMETSP0113_2-20130426/18489_1 /TAXON_ID=91329 /ORGANISM="Norrisiella sphaerica, Strain BC52" /LENGTH=277 /DNA_ID=CAMNT_0026874641 /DNA_START=217 /DNA_END=1050 /DNA_ORIENTATION=-